MILPPKPLDDDERQKLCEDFAYAFSQKEITDRIEEALDHKAVLKHRSEYLYCRNWLRRDAEKLGTRPPPERDTGRYFVWPNRRA